MSDAERLAAIPGTEALDISVAHPARIYDAWLGGKDIHLRFPQDLYRPPGRALTEERRWQHPGTPGVWRPSS